jgi:hypothetical protein
VWQRRSFDVKLAIGITISFIPSKWAIYDVFNVRKAKSAAKAELLGRGFTPNDWRKRLAFDSHIDVCRVQTPSGTPIKLAASIEGTVCIYL